MVVVLVNTEVALLQESHGSLRHRDGQAHRAANRCHHTTEYQSVQIQKATDQSYHQKNNSLATLLYILRKESLSERVSENSSQELTEMCHLHLPTIQRQHMAAAGDASERCQLFTGMDMGFCIFAFFGSQHRIESLI